MSYVWFVFCNLFLSINFFNVKIANNICPWHSASDFLIAKAFLGTAQKRKFLIKDSFCKYDQMWSYLLNKSLIENIFVVQYKQFDV